LVIGVVEGSGGLSSQRKLFLIFFHLHWHPIHVVNVKEPSVVDVLAAGSVTAFEETTTAASEDEIFPGGN
jgi:hypothetical protein